MRKILIVITVALVSCHSVKSQVAYYDALNLKASLNGKVFNIKTDTILAYYFNIPVTLIASTGVFTDSINALLKSNPFLSNYTLDGGVRSLAGKLSLSGISGNVGGLDVSKFANAISALMIERAKEELNIAFFNRFKKFAEENPEFGVLFPKSTDVLSSLLEYKYPEMLPALRNSFFEDLKLITYNLDDVLELPRYQTLLRNFPEVRIAIKSIRIVHELENGASNAADIIKEFSSFPEWNAPSDVKVQSVGSCLKIATLFSESIRNDTNQSHTNDVWVNAKDLKQLFNDSILLKIYLGLIWQQSVKESIKYIDVNGNKTDFSKLLEKQKDDIFLLQNKLKEFVDLTGNVNTAFKDLQRKIKNDEKPSNDDIYNYISTSIDVIEYSYSIATIFDKKHPVANNYLAFVKKSNSLYKSVYTKKYSQAIKDALDIFEGLDTLIKSKIKINIDSIRSAVKTGTYSSSSKEIKKLAKGRFVRDSDIDAVASADTSNANIEKLVEYYNLDKLSSFIKNVKPYALFMANVVNADNAEDIKSALNAVILPVGSSGIKKYSCFNISVQSYLGAYYNVVDLKDELVSSWSDKFGVTAPIGISLNTGFKKCGSIGIFAALIDLGAIVDYQLTNDSAVNSNGQTVAAINKDYKIELGQIFSPGVFVQYGFAWNLPLSLGLGAQYGPGLSKIDSSGDPVVNNPQWRVVASFTVDLPFFTLYNKSKLKN